MDIDEMVIECIKECCKKEEIELDCNRSLDSQGINSFIFIQVIVNLEELFHIEFEDEFLNPSNFKYVNEIADYIKQRLNNDMKEDIKNN